MNYWIIDAHEDLAYNALTFGRNYLLSAAETRAREVGTLAPERNGDTLLGWPDYQRGHVGLVFATLFAAPRRYGEAWDTQAYTTFAQARAIYHAQMEYYLRLWGDHPDKFSHVQNRAGLAQVVNSWQDGSADFDTRRMGLLILMEGAEALEMPEELIEWWQAGVRIVGPVWAGTRYCGGMHEPGRFTKDGLRLLDIMAELGMILDISHMNEESALQALDVFPGPVVASHANARAVLQAGGERHLTDATLRRLIERDGVVGILPLSHFMRRDHVRGSRRSDTPLDWVAIHMDHICQLAGNARHVALGTDFDGGFGVQHVPAEIDTIADLQKLGPLLEGRGYSREDVQGILAGNWQRKLEAGLPE